LSLLRTRHFRIAATIVPVLKNIRFTTRCRPRSV
jgi:hypothetical protein